MRGEPVVELAAKIEAMAEVRVYYGSPPDSECEVWVERIRGEGWKVGGTTGDPEVPPQLLDDPMAVAAEVLDALEGDRA